MDSSPSNDRLAYLTLQEVQTYLDEIDAQGFETEEIGFTGGEPFMNKQIIPMITEALERNHRVLVLTNAMTPLSHYKDEILALQERFGDRLTLRVSLDHHTGEKHDKERGVGSWTKTMEILAWLQAGGLSLAVAGRTCWTEDAEVEKLGYARLFKKLGLDLDVNNPAHLVLFPEMDETIETPEITTHCWGILGLSPDTMMCASSRMVVRHKEQATPNLVACTLLPYAPEFSMGTTLSEANRPVKLNHPHCSKFCVLGGGACSVG